jgi:predicted  nucleic acid-binding Zn-ribbon protein
MSTKVIFAFLSLVVCLTTYAQDTKVTDDELVRYATAIDSINEMSADVRTKLADMVKENPGITASRYNELSKIAGDEAKLAEAKATPEEIAVLKEVAEKKAEETARINETYQTLAKEYVTAPVFNKVKKALAEEPEVKARYDSLITELGKDNPK